MPVSRAQVTLMGPTLYSVWYFQVPETVFHTCMTGRVPFCARWCGGDFRVRGGPSDPPFWFLLVFHATLWFCPAWLISQALVPCVSRPNVFHSPPELDCAVLCYSIKIFKRKLQMASNRLGPCSWSLTSSPGFSWNTYVCPWIHCNYDLEFLSCGFSINIAL